MTFTFFGANSHSLHLESLYDLPVRTPECTHSGLGSSAFARRYLRNHYCFLFLSLLRCFSSGGSRLHTMDSCAVAAGLPQQVSPFRDPRITGYLLLPAAYRSLSRLSSALSANASTLRSFCLTASCPLAYGHAAGHDSLHSNEFMFCMPPGMRVSLWIRISYRPGGSRGPDPYSPRMSRYSN